MRKLVLNRGDTTGLNATVTDSSNTLMGKRLTWSVATRTSDVPVLTKVGGLPGSTDDITISSQVSNQIDAIINLTQADYAKLTGLEYRATLWLDDGTAQRCVTAGGYDILVIADTVPRS